MALSPLTTTFKPDSESPGTFVINAYGPNYIEVNGERHSSPLILRPESGPMAWSAQSLSCLSADDFRALAELRPEVVIVGTGEKQVFLHPTVLAPLTSMRIGVECMGMAAACRTYNILMSEGRKVALALVF